MKERRHTNRHGRQQVKTGSHLRILREFCKDLNIKYGDKKPWKLLNSNKKSREDNKC